MEQTMSLRRSVGTRVRQLERLLRERPLSPEQRQEQANRQWWERWLEAAGRLLMAVTPEQQHTVAERLRHWLDRRGPVGADRPGLVAWLYWLEHGRGFLPARLPVELIDVYLRDDRAQPDHDCEDCGLRIPIRPSVIDDRSFVHCVFRGVAEEEVRYLPRCPHCGGATAQGAYWAKHRREVVERPPGR
jgi:hypothetical protein